MALVHSAFGSVNAWSQVLEVKSTASKQTDVFSVNGSKWRIRWQKSEPESRLNIYVFAQDGSAVDAISTKNSKNDESYIHKAGSFYLRIDASTAYTITVEDWH